MDGTGSSLTRRPLPRNPLRGNTHRPKQLTTLSGPNPAESDQGRPWPKSGVMIAAPDVEGGGDGACDVRFA